MVSGVRNCVDNGPIFRMDRSRKGSDSWYEMEMSTVSVLGNLRD